MLDFFFLPSSHWPNVSDRKGLLFSAFITSLLTDQTCLFFFCTWMGGWKTLTQSPGTSDYGYIRFITGTSNTWCFEHSVLLLVMCCAFWDFYDMVLTLSLEGAMHARWWFPHFFAALSLAASRFLAVATISLLPFVTVQFGFHGNTMFPISHYWFVRREAVLWFELFLCMNTKRKGGNRQQCVDCIIH